MDAKLTLKLDQDIVAEAKKYAKDKNLSLSKLVENYLHQITKQKIVKEEISPLVKSLSGILKLEEQADYKKDYTSYLSKKYK
jgi:hypothetical protein